jgi:hypothetical protein
MNSDNSVRLYDDQIKKNAQITKISVLNSQKVASTQIGIDECFYIEVEYDVKQEINQAILALVLYSVSGELLFMTTENDRTGETRKYEVGKYKALVAIPSFLLNVGNYYFDISIQDPFVEYFDLKKNVNFAIINSNNPKNKILKGNNLGFISTILDYKLEKIK